MNESSATSRVARYDWMNSRELWQQATAESREAIGSSTVTRLLTLAVTIAAETHVWHFGDGDGGNLHRQLDQIAAELGLRDVEAPFNGERRGIVLLLADRDGWCCTYCDSPLDGHDTSLPPPQVDHVLPKSRGGGNELANLALACGPCNMSKSARTPEEWKDAT